MIAPNINMQTEYGLEYGFQQMSDSASIPVSKN